MKFTDEEPVLPRKALFEVLDDRSEVVNLYQKYPFTCIVVRSWYSGQEYIGYGFSKDTVPNDKTPHYNWNAEQWANLAYIRAMIMIMREVRGRERGRARMAAWESMMEDLRKK